MAPRMDPARHHEILLVPVRLGYPGSRVSDLIADFAQSRTVATPPIKVTNEDLFALLGESEIMMIDVDMALEVVFGTEEHQALAARHSVQTRVAMAIIKVFTYGGVAAKTVGVLRAAQKLFDADKTVQP